MLPSDWKAWSMHNQARYLKSMFEDTYNHNDMARSLSASRIKGILQQKEEQLNNQISDEFYINSNYPMSNQIRAQDNVIYAKILNLLTERTELQKSTSENKDVLLLANHKNIQDLMGSNPRVALRVKNLYAGSTFAMPSFTTPPTPTPSYSPPPPPPKPSKPSSSSSSSSSSSASTSAGKTKDDLTDSELALYRDLWDKADNLFKQFLPIVENLTQDLHEELGRINPRDYTMNAAELRELRRQRDLAAGEAARYFYIMEVIKKNITEGTDPIQVQRWANELAVEADTDIFGWKKNLGFYDLEEEAIQRRLNPHIAYASETEDEASLSERLRREREKLKKGKGKKRN